MRREARWILLGAVLLVAVVGLAAASATAGGEQSPSTDAIVADAHIHECAATPPADHADPDGDTDEVIGWVEGYWYNESLDIDADDGLNESDVESLAARTAAQVEALRCLTFEEMPDIQFLTRDEHSERIEEALEDVTDAEWQWEQARLAKKLYAGQDTDPFEVHLEFRTGFPAAFYNFEDEFMGFIVEEPGDIEIDQVTLAHELQHALQDQHFDLGGLLDVDYSDQSMAGRAIAEGDAVLLDGMYEQRCDEGEWVDECIIPLPDPADDPEHWGMVLEMLAAYHTPLIAQTHEDAGWDAVDAIFEDPPNSMKEVIDPELYGEFEPVAIEVPDLSNDEWDRIVDEDGEAIADRIGQHGVAAMLLAPVYETGGEVEPVNIDRFLTEHIGGDVSYGIPEVSGWQNDYLYAYENDAGETGSVWKIAWENANQAETFADSYETAILGLGGESLAEDERLYSLDPLEGYDLAIEVTIEDDRVWIVSAPDQGDLDAVHGEAVTPTPTPTPTPVDDDGIPGVGIVGVVMAFVVLSYALARRRR